MECSIKTEEWSVMWIPSSQALLIKIQDWAKIQSVEYVISKRKVLLLCTDAARSKYVDPVWEVC